MELRTVKKILVIGATGFVGKHLLPKLVELGYTVYATTRYEQKFGQISDLGATPVVLDISDANSFSDSILSEIDIVINLSTIINEKRGEKFQDTLYQGCKNIFDFYQDKDLVKIIQLGAISSQEKPVDERKPYLYWKKKGTNFFVGKKLNYVLLETSFIYGEGDQHFSTVAWLFKLFSFYPMAGKKMSKLKVQPVYVQDLIKCIILSIRENTYDNKTYQIGGRETLYYRELVKIIGRKIGKQRILTFNKSLSYFSLNMFSYLFRYIPIPKTFLDYIDLDTIVDSDMNISSFGIEPSSIHDNIDYLSKIKISHFKNWT